MEYYMVNFRLQVITVPGKYNGKALLNDFRRIVKNNQEQVRRDLKKTVSTWTKKPKFFVRSVRDPNNLEIIAGTENELYQMLDRGTEPHEIKASTNKFLRFNPNAYTPKSTPKFIGSNTGGFAGTGETFAKKVMHPGTEPRLWVFTISEKVKSKLETDLEQKLGTWVTIRHRNARAQQKVAGLGRRLGG